MVEKQSFKECLKQLRCVLHKLKEINQKIDYLINREKIEYDPNIADLFRFLLREDKKRKN